ncbi:MAG: type II secretion system protein GspG [Kiritimatiellae bacterium]|nr:type II secretion system protein GspG [Kiritimatiellia bacterium]
MTMENKVQKTEMSRRAGFTLIEVLLVVAILGMLAGVVAVKFGGKSKGALIKTTRVSIAALSTAVDMYEVDTGRYPASLNNLMSSDGAPNWNGPYLKGKGLPQDGWGIPFTYQKSGDSYKIISAGPDTSMGGGDDITSF